jgi:hypothetical protein
VSSYYGVIFSRFWTGDTGRELRRRGGKDAQLLGVYLFSNAYMNMLGLYPLKVRDIRDDIDLSPAQLAKAFAVMQDLEYAFFDAGTNVVWVREMATFRLSLKDREPLKPSDNRVAGAQRLYSSLPPNPWLGPFFDRYGKILRLRSRREGPPQDIGDSGDSLALRRGRKGASEGGFEASKQNQDQDQNTGSGSEKSSAAHAARSRLSGETPDENYSVIEKLAHTAIQVLGVSNVDDLDEDIKRRCAQAHIAYNSAVVTAARKSAVHQRGLR